MTQSSIPTVDIHWIINGTRVEGSDIHFSNVEQTYIESGVGVLIFNNVSSDYNLTRVRCRAELISGVYVSSEEITIILLIKSMCRCK